MLSQIAVEVAFKKFNRKFFKNQLPADTDLRISKVCNYLLGYQQGDKIVLSRKYRRDSIWKMTLLHEMVHLKLDGTPEHERNHHGPAFEKEMRRLARAGAFKGIW